MSHSDGRTEPAAARLSGISPSTLDDVGPPGDVGRRVARNVEAWRDRRGMTRATLALRVGIDRRALDRRLPNTTTGEVDTTFDVDEVAAAAVGLDVSLLQLFADTPG